MLRYDSYCERVQPRKGQKLDSPMNQHQLIIHLELGNIQVGVNIPIDRLATFPNDDIKPLLKQIKILAINITAKNLEEELKLVREFVGKHLKFPAQKLHLHV